MQSDATSLKESGGIAPKPQTIKLEAMEESAPVFAPKTVNQLPGGVVAGGGNRAFRVMAQILGSVGLVVGLGLLGYYVIYPLLFPGEGAQPVTNQNEEAAPVPPEVAAPAPAVHESLFEKAPQAEAQVSLVDLSAADIIDALQTEAKNVSPAGTLKEIAISKNNSQVAFGNYMSALFSNLSAAELSAIAENDFTAFLYYNDKGVWPGYVARLKADTTAAEAATIFSQIESSDVSKLFISYPGVSSGFKTGPYKGYPVRYAAFSKPGASINYGVIGNYIILTTSFDGLKAAANLLGM